MEGRALGLFTQLSDGALWKKLEIFHQKRSLRLAPPLQISTVVLIVSPAWGQAHSRYSKIPVESSSSKVTYMAEGPKEKPGLVRKWQDQIFINCFSLTARHHAKCLYIFKLSAATAAAKSLQLCPTLCNPIDGSPPGSAVPGILQARTLEWVAISFSNA